MFYQEQISAAAPLHINVSGRYFLLESTGAEESVAVTLLRNGSPIFGRIPAAKRGHKYGVESGFDGVRIEAGGNTTVQFFATFENVSISTTDGAQVEVPGGVMVTNTGADPVPVLHTGTVELTADNVGVLSPDVLLPLADVAIAAGAQGLLVAAAAVGVKQRETIIKNLVGNTDLLRIGDVSCAAGLGHELAPGETIKLDTLAAVYAWNTGAAAQSVSVLTNSRS